MHLSDLLRMEAVDWEGRKLGHVRDVRLRSVQESWEVSGLVVGRGALAERLGYAYGPVKGPGLVRWVMSHWARHARFVDWNRVELVGGVVTVKAADEKLKHPRE